jgi:hypothetical protein
MLKALEEKLETASRATRQVRPKRMKEAGDVREKIPSKIGGLVNTESKCLVWTDGSLLSTSMSMTVGSKNDPRFEFAST